MRRFVLLIVALAACGDDDPVRHLDAGIDSPPMMMIDAPNTPQPVTLTITSGTTPMAGVRVYFQNSDSSLVSSTVTDASGVASAVMQAGGFVTALRPFATPAGIVQDDIRTFAGVKPGDHLVLKESLGQQTTQVTFTADLDPGATGYEFWTKCGSSIVVPDGSASAASVMLYLTDDCMAGVDTVVASLDQNNEVIHFFYAPQATVAAAAVDLTGKAYDGSPTTKTYTYSNPLANMSDLNITQTLSSTHGDVVAQYGSTTAGALTLKLPAFTGAVDSVLAFGFTPLGTHGFFDWGPTVTTSLSVDLGARALTEATGFPTYDANAHAFTWTPATGGQAADFVVSDVTANRDVPLMSWRWQLATPYTAGRVTLPVLPVESAGPDYNIGATDAAYVNSMTLAKVPGGYDAVRALVLAADGGPTSVISAATGSITIEDISQVPQRKKNPAPHKIDTRPTGVLSHRSM